MRVLFRLAAAALPLAVASTAMAVAQDPTEPRPRPQQAAPATRPVTDPPPAPRRIEPPIMEVPVVKLDLSKTTLPTGGAAGGGSHWEGVAAAEQAAAQAPVQPQQPPPSVVPPPQFLRYDPAYFGGYGGYGYGGGSGYYDPYGYGGGYGTGIYYVNPTARLGSGVIAADAIGTVRSNYIGSLGVSIIPPANNGNAAGVRFMTDTYRGSGGPTPLPAHAQSIRDFRPTYNGFTPPPGNKPFKYPGGGGSRAATPNPRPGT